EAKDKEAEAQLEQMHARAAEQERQRTEMLAKAQKEADERRNEMIQQAREAVRALQGRWQQDLEREESAFLDEVRRRAAAEILAVVRRALADLACADVQQCALQVFLEKLNTVDVAALRDLARDELTVLSATDLSEEQRRKVQSALERRLEMPVRLQFQRAPAMTWGVELRGNGRRIGWNSESYVDSLEDSLGEALEHRAEVLVG